MLKKIRLKLDHSSQFLVLLKYKSVTPLKKTEHQVIGPLADAKENMVST
jgi:hypothetical protein